MIAETTRWVILKKLPASIDIPNSGEQPRKSFFVYARHRMSGYSGHGWRRPPQDVTRYPLFAGLHAGRAQAKTTVCSFAPPKVTSLVAHLACPAIENECAEFRAILDDLSADVGGYVLPFANFRHAHEYRIIVGHRLADDQFCRTPRVRRRPDRPLRRKPGRSDARPGRNRLRLRHLGRHGAGRRRHDVSKYGRPAGLRASCQRVLILKGS